MHLSGSYSRTPDCMTALRKWRSVRRWFPNLDHIFNNFSQVLVNVLWFQAFGIQFADIGTSLWSAEDKLCLVDFALLKKMFWKS